MWKKAIQDRVTNPMHTLIFTCSVELCCYALEVKCSPVKSNPFKLWSLAGDCSHWEVIWSWGLWQCQWTDNWFKMVVRKTFKSRAWLKKVGHSLPPGHQRWASLLHPDDIMVFCLVSDKSNRSRRHWTENLETMSQNTHFLLSNYFPWVFVPVVKSYTPTTRLSAIICCTSQEGQRALVSVLLEHRWWNKPPPPR